MNAKHHDHRKPDKHDRAKWAAHHLGAKPLKKEQQRNDGDNNTHRKAIAGYDGIFKAMHAV